jgi:hypothetical protein
MMKGKFERPLQNEKKKMKIKNFERSNVGSEG